MWFKPGEIVKEIYLMKKIIIEKENNLGIVLV
jgi:hypothetical protein